MADERTITVKNDAADYSVTFTVNYTEEDGMDGGHGIIELATGSENNVTVPVYAKNIKVNAEAVGNGAFVLILSENIPAAGDKTYRFTGTIQNPHYHVE